ncbi:MAG TPA: methyl-accepting chemotaxis protein [Spirochaetota bacterium]|nr:methyl-accepting chemotaxis protein [Spirochaetota bacterium]
MKLKSKINLLNVSVFMSMVFFVVLTGSIIIGSIVHKLNSKIIDLKMEDIYKKIVNSYNVLNDTGMSGFDNYVEQTQSELLEDFKKINYGKTGSFYVLTYDKVVIYHKTLKIGEKLNLGFIDTMVADKDTGIPKDITYNFQGKDRYACYMKFDQWKWILGFSIEKSEMYGERNQFIIIIGLLSLFLIIISVLLTSFLTGKIIINPLRDFSSKIKSISEGEGDLTQKLVIERDDEIGDFSKYFNNFIDKLNSIIVQIKNTTNSSKDMSLKLTETVSENSNMVENISSSMTETLSQIKYLNSEMDKSNVSVNEINSYINNVVFLIEDQSASVNESSASIEEMIASINNIAMVAEDKKNLTANLTKLAKDGEVDMQKTVASIEEIAKSAGVIFDMIKVINSVAEQTNLLAMNAAIEAAHAGEYGKGFAVVADEIRKLAETTGANSKNISQSLKVILDKIKNTSESTKKTGGTINDIIRGIVDISNSMNEMTNGMKELSIGSNQIIESLNNLISVTENVKNSSKEMNLRSGNIETSVKNVVLIAEKNKESIEKSNDLIIKTRVNLSILNELSNKNQKNIESIEKEVLKFKTN